MPGTLRGRAAPALAISLGLGLAACAGATPSSTTAGPPSHRVRPPSTPAKDTFIGSIIAGTGAYSTYRGRATIYLQPTGVRLNRPVRITVIGNCRAHRAGCMDLNGTLSGTLTRSGHQIPDTGQGYTLSGTGTVQPLGQTRASGGVEGTGFIARGQELMRLTLATSSGSITLSALSKAVKGFSSP